MVRIVPAPLKTFVVAFPCKPGMMERGAATEEDPMISMEDEGIQQWETTKCLA